MRKFIIYILILTLLLSMALPAAAAEKADIVPYAKLLLRYYRHHGEAAEDVIWDLLQSMEGVDPDQAAVWRRLMKNWSKVNTTLPVSQGSLPQGLPDDGSMAIVVLGYALNDDGTMKEELIDRLVVALTCALQYPNAPIVVTGGQTGEVPGVTEAGRMAAWLQNKGIDKGRIYQDIKSYSTTANAQNTYALLRSQCPQVTQVAIVTSDYHLSWGAAAFAAQSDYSFGYEGGSPIEVAAGAVCSTGRTYDSLAQQAWAISTITGIPFEEWEPAPELYAVARPPEPETQPAPEPEADFPLFELFPHKEEHTEEAAEAVAPEEKKEPPALLIILIPALAAWLLLPKKPRKKRKKPQWNWEV